MAKRSSTLKQFLLRVHPDHFRNLPKAISCLILQVHDENLQSVKLLNQFMDDHYASQGRGSMGWRRRGSPKEKKDKRLKRFSLELAANIEAKMVAVLQECGVVVQSVEKEESSQPRRSKKEKRPDEWRHQRNRPSGMDFGGFTMAEMYAKANRPAARRRKPIQSLKELLEFMKEDETMEIQKRRQIAWQSIQSVRGTLKRELGLEDVLFSCGWSTMHLNTTIMILLQTLRKYTRANKQGIFAPKDFLRGATIDISANPSGIDFSNEYRIGLNPADVPVQWVQVLETIDANMVLFMKAARESLASLQTDATAALGHANISRGHTCSALGYRTFLQNMRQRGAPTQHGEQELLEKYTVVIEDASYEWRILETGKVRVPFTSSYGEAVTFLNKNRSQIRRQQEAHNANLEVFAYIASRCTDAMHIKTITCDDGIPVADAIVACEELLKTVSGMTPQSSRDSIPHEMVRFLDTYTQGRSICISRTYGLGQDGVFTLPVDWFRW
ncbi:mitochondrial protein [Phytophthora palmivora]|uniref:Mitochondrial protein n=1 Tax=Phytophthora palmivora TaxID=4796 RepID=A0A2P4X8H3_9STRA|nr:mitochondrial protein [Phytophthora palmivora]